MLTFKRVVSIDLTVVFNAVKVQENMCFEEVECLFKQEQAEGNSSWLEFTVKLERHMLICKDFLFY